MRTDIKLRLLFINNYKKLVSTDHNSQGLSSSSLVGSILKVLINNKVSLAGNTYETNAAQTTFITRIICDTSIPHNNNTAGFYFA
ncbi:hypothetical protein AT705_07955 [Pseudoalteromonas rubra]|uniref:Uncharacterized protein n=1 Tax=Pseudoalteromonas rubra TaxID=43658 RepID=A0A0U3I5D5_9GAMM|nr:hypothetical protein AT705_07955 [Pseudoalteromonas rubra]